MYTSPHAYDAQPPSLFEVSHGESNHRQRLASFLCSRTRVHGTRMTTHRHDIAYTQQLPPPARVHDCDEDKEVFLSLCSFDSIPHLTSRLCPSYTHTTQHYYTALPAHMELPPWDVVLKLLLLQTGLGLLLLLLVRQVLAWKGRKHFPPLTGGSVLLTGTSSGIGRTAAVYLAQRGFTVLAGVRKESDAQALRGIGLSGIHPVIIDVAKPDSVQACHAHVLSLLSAKTIPPLVAVINNAGLLQDATVEFHDMDTMRHMFDVNYFGLVTVSSVFLPLLRGASSSPKGRLINIGSVAGKVSFPRYGAYAASKHAVEAITDTLRAELTPAGVSVSLIQPGFCRTELFVRGVAQPQAAQSHAKNDTVSTFVRDGREGGEWEE